MNLKVRLIDIAKQYSEKKDLPDTEFGHQDDRFPLVAELCAQNAPGDLVEIGANTGNRTVIWAEVARKYDRKLLVVDPWITGTQNCEGHEFDEFLKKIEPFRDVIQILRAPSQSMVAIQAMTRPLCFAYVDGSHYCGHALSDILAVAHTRGIIAVDDFHCDKPDDWMAEVHLATQVAWMHTDLELIHFDHFKEAYLISK